MVIYLRDQGTFQEGKIRGKSVLKGYRLEVEFRAKCKKNITRNFKGNHKLRKYKETEVITRRVEFEHKANG